MAPGCAGPGGRGRGGDRPGLRPVGAERLPARLRRGRGGQVQRYGFAYGTLPEHAESGEERFTVEWHEADDAVWYDILAFSRPHQLLVRLGYPLARRLQKRFARDSAA